MRLSRKKLLLCALSAMVFYGGDLSALNIASAANSASVVTTDWTLENGESITVSGSIANELQGVSTSTSGLTLTANAENTIKVTNTTGSVSGIALNGTGNKLTLTGSAGTLKIEAEGQKVAYGIATAGMGGALQSDKALDIKVVNHSDGEDVVGIYVQNSSDIAFNKKVKIAVSTDEAVVRAFGIVNSNSQMNFKDDVEVELTTTGNLDAWAEYATGIDTSNSGATTFDGRVKVINNGAADNADMIGVGSFFGSSSKLSATVFNNSLQIIVNNTKGNAIGLLSYQYGSIAVKNDLIIEATGKDAASSVAIMAAGYGGIGGTVDVSKNALSAADTDAVQAKITGHIQADTNNSTVNINITGAESFIKGGITTEATNSVTALALHNKAAWNNTTASNLTSLTMDAGIINQSKDTANTIAINNYSGTGTINFAGEVTDGQFAAQGANVTINAAAAGSTLTLAAASDGTNTLERAKAAASLNSLAQKFVYKGNDGNLKGTAAINEGLITPQVSGKLQYDTVSGTATVNTSDIYWHGTTTTTMETMKDIATVNLLAWRNENSSLLKRLGDIRGTQTDQGIWATMTRGEFEYSGNYNNQYNRFQLGYDQKLTQPGGDAWYIGAAVGYTDSKTAFAAGNGTNKSLGISVYGSWLGSKGHYWDLVLKQSRLTTDYDTYVAAGHTHGRYHNWGTSLSAEYGRKLALKNNWFLEPQAELTFGRLGGADYTTDNGIMIRQDTMYSIVGRIGFTVGKTFPEQGRIYVRAGLLHEFRGTADTYLALNGVENTYKQETGATWYELGLGGNFKLNKNTRAYIDVEKTVGSNIKTPWQWNVGLRWGF